MNLKLVFFFIPFLLATSTTYSQQNNTLTIEELSKLTDNLQNETAAENLYEVLLNLSQSPIELNSTDATGLTVIPFLSNRQIQSFLDYRNNYGPLLSVYELQAIPHFDLKTIRHILPFVTLKAKDIRHAPLWKRILEEKNNYLLLRHIRSFPKAVGYLSDTPAYAGSADKILLRFRTSHSRDFSMAFTAEKDAGEAFKWSAKQKQYGMDFYAGHIQLSNRGKFRQVILGDFQLQSGQGLIFGAGFFAGKTAETVRLIQKADFGLIPYSSAGEQGFFRGLAAKIELNEKFTLQTFVSYNKIDARLKKTDSEKLKISSLPITGLHRTTSEAEVRKKAGRFTTGHVISWKTLSGQLTSGFSFAYTHFQFPVLKSKRLYKKFDFDGQQNITAGPYFNLNWQNFSFFSEFAISSNLDKGFIAGTSIQLSRNYSLAILYRKYQKGFHSFYQKAFGEQTNAANEQGFYLGMEIKPFPKLNCNFYIDQFQFPWLRFRVNSPSQGFEWLSRFHYEFNSSSSLKLQLKQQQKALNSRDSLLYLPTPTLLSRSLLSFEHRIDKALSFKSQVQFTHYQIRQQNDYGMLLFQEINYSYNKYKISSRITFFDTDSYDSRQYVYEKGLWPSFSLPAYFGTGSNFYLLVKVKHNRKLKFSTKFSYSQYSQQTSIGSGHNLIEHPSKFTTHLQMTYRFN